MGGLRVKLAQRCLRVGAGIRQALLQIYEKRFKPVLLATYT